MPSLDKKIRHNIEVVVDRLIIKEGIETRLSDSMRTALDLSDGIAYVEILSNNEKEKIISFFQRIFHAPFLVLQLLK